MRPRYRCYLCEDARYYLDEHDVRHPCVCTRRPPRGHLEDCGWVYDDPPERDREPEPEPEHDGPMPEAEVGGWE